MKLEPGDQFTAEIDDFVVGKAIVKDGRDIINVGPLDCEPGTSVHLKYLGEETTSEENKIPYAVSLDDSLHGDGYDQYIQNRVRDMLPDRPPESGEITYAEIQTIGQRNLAQTVLGGETIELGPVNAREGDLVKIEGVSDGFAKVLTDSASGQNYEMRFNILAQISAKIPVDVGDEFTTIISHVEENQLAATVKGVPVVFQSGDAQKAQKVDGRITGFEKDQAVAEITERHDEVGRVSDTGIWARRQWLQDAINSEEPLRDLACEFLKCSPEALPETDSRVRDALIAEAIRLALHEKAEFNPDEYPRVHVMGLRHWVEHKLGAVLGWLDEGDDWFSSILTDRNGPTLTFLGDIMKLANGYYAPAPTRAVMAGDGDAVLISGAPTRYFQRDDLDLEVRGLSRVVTDTQPGTGSPGNQRSVN